MSYGVIFAGGFVLLLLLRFVLLTVAFIAMLSAGNRCPICDAATVRVESRLYERLLPGVRKSWCLTCGWTGLLRYTRETQPTLDVRRDSARR